MKILRSRDNPLIKKGLSLKQRLSHFAAVFTYFDAYQKLIYLLTPAILLFTGIMPIKVIDGFDFLIHWLPYFTLTMFVNTILGRGYFSYLEVEKYNTLKMITFIKASFSLVFGKNAKFKVTPKTMEKSEKQKDRRELFIHMIILVLIIISVLFAALNSVLDQINVEYPSVVALVIAIFWAVMNSVILFLSLYEVFKRAYFRSDYRFNMYLRGMIIVDEDERYPCEINNISKGGLSLTCKETDAFSPVTGDHFKIRLKTPDGVFKIPVEAVYSKKAKDSIVNVGTRFGKLDSETEKKLYKFLFVTLPREIFEANNICFIKETRAQRRACNAENRRG